MAKNYKQVNDEKQSFVVYKSWEEGIKLLSDVEQAQMLRNLFLWHRNEDPVLNTTSLQLVWKLIEFNLIQNAENYDKRSETSSKNGKSGGAPKGNKNALKTKYHELNQPNQPNQPNSTYNNPNDHVNVNDDGNGNDDGNDDVYDKGISDPSDPSIAPTPRKIRPIIENILGDKKRYTSDIEMLILNNRKRYDTYTSFSNDIEKYKLSSSQEYSLYELV